MMLDIVPPPGISPEPSLSVHSSPSERVTQVPVDFIAGWSGPIMHSPSKVHSPTSRCNQRCSLDGSAIIGQLSCVVSVFSATDIVSSSFSASTNGSALGERLQVLQSALHVTADHLVEAHEHAHHLGDQRHRPVER